MIARIADAAAPEVFEFFFLRAHTSQPEYKLVPTAPLKSATALRLAMHKGADVLRRGNGRFRADDRRWCNRTAMTVDGRRFAEDREQILQQGNRVQGIDFSTAP